VFENSWPLGPFRGPDLNKRVSGLRLLTKAALAGKPNPADIGSLMLASLFRGRDSSFNRSGLTENAS
jgi:hypothetical protein